jgi:hypothetical protein
VFGELFEVLAVRLGWGHFEGAGDLADERDDVVAWGSDREVVVVAGERGGGGFREVTAAVITVPFLS